MKDVFVHTLLLTCLLTAVAGCRAVDDLDSPLLNQFWSPGPDTEHERVTAALIDEAGDLATLYAWLQRGPAFPADAPRGQLQRERVDADGTAFPYVILVPDNYRPDRRWPVEFNLHGGVNRPRVEDGGTLWRQGYDALRDPERIVVLPAAWNEAFWWFPNQAENLPAILDTLKRTYNIDENRVTLTGVSDGGTGAFFFAFFHPTPWAAFLPYIGNPGVLRNPNAAVSYPLFYENLRGKPFYIVNGENDRLYPAERAVRPHINAMEEAAVDFTWVVIPDGGHNTEWMPQQRPMIDAFKRRAVRDPLPDVVQWTSNRTDRFNRNHWLIITGREQAGAPARVEARRSGNRLELTTRNTSALTLLLSPQEIDFSSPVTVTVNGTTVYHAPVTQSAQTLLQWAARDRDRTMLFTAELTLGPDALSVGSQRNIDEQQ
jgi:predicted esterase